jgi:hypothetical protein
MYYLQQFVGGGSYKNSQEIKVGYVELGLTKFPGIIL